MLKVQVLNNISLLGLDKFSRDVYKAIENIRRVEGILTVRIL